MFRFYSKPDSVRATLVGVHEDGRLKIAASRCSERDTFSRKKGIEIAEKRLRSGKFIFDQEMSDISASDFVRIASVLSEPVLRAKATSSR